MMPAIQERARMQEDLRLAMKSSDRHSGKRAAPRPAGIVAHRRERTRQILESTAEGIFGWTPKGASLS